jgi:hypothetical protein
MKREKKSEREKEWCEEEVKGRRAGERKGSESE